MNLYTKESGTGQPMVLLHGNGEDSSYFVNQMSFFESKYHVIAVDTRGHGRSPRGQGAFTLERFAEDLKEFLDRRGLRRIILLGFSDGGNIALIFALKYPGYVFCALVFLSSSATVIALPLLPLYWKFLVSLFHSQ